MGTARGVQRPPSAYLSLQVVGDAPALPSPEAQCWLNFGCLHQNMSSRSKLTAVRSYYRHARSPGHSLSWRNRDSCDQLPHVRICRTQVSAQASLACACNSCCSSSPKICRLHERGNVGICGSWKPPAADLLPQVVDVSPVSG